VEDYQAELATGSTGALSVELSSVELVASIEGRLWPVATLGRQLRATARSILEALWPWGEAPYMIARLA
jgi:hypothetical protein